MDGFAERLRAERRARGWTIGILATRAELPYSTLYGLERGDANPREQTLLGLARALELPVEELESWKRVAA